MRISLLLLVACSSSARPAESTTTTTTSDGSAAQPTGSGAPPITELEPKKPDPLPPTPPPTPPTPPPSAPKKPLYSCFSYLAANTTTKRHNCMRTPDCPDLLEQAKQIKGIRELTGCASVPSVWCFHQLVKGDPEGVDVCQPTQADCTTARASAVKAKESVDTECAQR